MLKIVEPRNVCLDVLHLSGFLSKQFSFTVSNYITVLLIWTRWLATPRLKNSFLMFVLLRFLNGFGLCPRWLHMLWYVVKNSLLPNMSSVFLPVMLYVCIRSPRNLLIFVVVGLRHRRKCLALHCVSKNRRNDYSDIKPEAEVTSRVLVRVRSRLDCADDRDLG